jgi:hypothetical protein
LEAALARCAQELVLITRIKAAAQTEVERAHACVAQLGAERDAARGTERRRGALSTRLTAAREALASALRTLNQDRDREQARARKLATELQEARELAEQRRTALARRRDEARTVLDRKTTIATAIEQAKTMGEAEARLRGELATAQGKHQAREEQSCAPRPKACGGKPGMRRCAQQA